MLEKIACVQEVKRNIPKMFQIILCTKSHLSWKGQVRIRKSKSDEKWNEQFVNDAYGVLLYSCCVSKLCSWVCTEAWEVDILSIFADIDAF